MLEIQLNKAGWTYDETAPLGPAGGFGEVFRGRGDVGHVAVKRLKLTASAAAHREMDIGQELAARELDHIVPVLDFGQDAGSDGYFLVMPICERSLQEELNSKGVLTLAEARSVALDALAGLREVDDIVHRDLKPGNILLHQGRWRLADFGIAKFVEDATSLQTLRNSLTPAYGAPEQWRNERSSHATDVYALGCILHAMLNGAPPFGGSADDMREAHLHRAAPPLGGDPRLAAFVGQMLRKPPAARPSLQRCVQVIGSVTEASARPLHAGLLAAAGQVSRETEEREAAAQAAATAKRERDELVREARRELDEILKNLWAHIREASDEASLDRHAAKLGRGTLAVSDVAAMAANQIRADPYGRSSRWEVIAGATMSVTRAKAVRPQRTPQDIPIVHISRMTSQDLDYSWGAALFFGRSEGDPNFRWREAAFWTSSSRGERDAPFALQADDKEFATAFSSVMGVTNVAYGPFPIDGEDEQDFQHRWLTLFSKAVSGELERPSVMPISDHYWR